MLPLSSQQNTSTCQKFPSLSQSRVFAALIEYQFRIPDKLKRASAESRNFSPTTTTTSILAMATQMSWQLRQRTPSPEARASNSHPKARTPRPDAYRPRGGSSSSASSSNLNLCMDEGASSPSPSPSRTRTLSRTQLRHATAARRLSAEGIVSNGGSAGGRRAKDAPVMNENLFPSDSGPQAGPSSSSQTPRRNGYGVTKDNNNTQNPQRPKLKRRPGSVTASEIIFALATGTDPSLSSATRPSAADQEIYRAIAQKADARKRESCADGSNERERSAPLLPKTLHAVGVNLMIDSTNLQSERIR